MEANYDTRNVTLYMEFGGFPPFLICTPGDELARSRHNIVWTLTT
jgi:hypothetical protein